MADDDVPSGAAIRGHPLHPLLVPFPIAFLVGALATDLAFWSTTDPFWGRASIWLIGSGLAMGALAAREAHRLRQHRTGAEQDMAQ